MVLIYRTDLLPAGVSLEAALKALQQPCRVVNNTEYTLPLGVLASGQELQTAGLPSGEIEEPMLVFCGFDGDSVSHVLKQLRSLGAPSVALKAVLTPINSRWTSLQLYQELKKEHAFFHKQ